MTIVCASEQQAYGVVLNCARTARRFGQALSSRQRPSLPKQDAQAFPVQPEADDGLDDDSLFRLAPVRSRQ